MVRKVATWSVKNLKLGLQMLSEIWATTYVYTYWQLHYCNRITWYHVISAEQVKLKISIKQKVSSVFVQGWKKYYSIGNKKTNKCSVKWNYQCGTDIELGESTTVMLLHIIGRFCVRPRCLKPPLYIIRAWKSGIQLAPLCIIIMLLLMLIQINY